MKFQPNSFNSVQLTERTCYKGNNLKNKPARVMVLVHDTLSKCALLMYEVFVEISLTVTKLQSGHDFVMNRQTDGCKGNSRPFQGVKHNNFQISTLIWRPVQGFFLQFWEGALGPFRLGKLAQ